MVRKSPRPIVNGLTPLHKRGRAATAGRRPQIGLSFFESAVIRRPSRIEKSAEAARVRPRVGRMRGSAQCRLRNGDEEQVMHMSWRTYALILLVGIWPHLGCHQVPGDKSVQDLRPIQQTADKGKKQELTAADITQSWIAKAESLEKAGKTGEAIALCEKMREPGNPQALQATKKLALIYDRNHDLYRASQEYQRILEQNPKDADTLCNLGYLNYR